MPSSREMRELGMEVTGQQCADGSWFRVVSGN